MKSNGAISNRFQTSNTRGIRQFGKIAGRPRSVPTDPYSRTLYIEFNKLIRNPVIRR